MPAAPPKRATAKVTLGFGLVSIPAKCYKGTEEHRSDRHEYIRVPIDDERVEVHKVGRQMIDKETGKVVTKDDVVKMIETEHGLVELSDAEIEQVLQPTNGTATIEHFVPLHYLGAGFYVPDGLMQIRPDKGGEATFSLLMAAMRRKMVFGLIALTNRSKIRYAALLPTGRLYTLLFDDEVRVDLDMPPATFDDEELDMALGLVDTILVEEPPLLRDKTRTRLQDYIDKKAETGEAPIVQETKAPSTKDLLNALRASVAANKSKKEG